MPCPAALRPWIRRGMLSWELTTRRTSHQPPRSIELRYDLRHVCLLNSRVGIVAADQNNIPGYVRRRKPHSARSTSHTLWLLGKTQPPVIHVVHKHSFIGLALVLDKRRRRYLARWRRNRHYRSRQPDESQPIRVAHHAGLHGRHQQFAHRAHRGHRLLSTSWMRRGGDKTKQLRRRLCTSWWWRVCSSTWHVGHLYMVLERESYPRYYWIWPHLTRFVLHSDLTSRKTFGLQRLRLLSTRPPGEHLALRTLAQPAITARSSHPNSCCSQWPSAAIGNYRFFPPCIHE